MKITEVRLHKTEGQEPVKAFASIVLDGQFAVGRIRIVEGSQGLFIAMPSTKGKDGKWHDIAFPITGKLRSEIEATVLDKFFDSLE